MATKKRGVSKQNAFLAAYISSASVTRAAKAAKVDRALPYRWAKEDPAFATAFARAKEEAAQVLEDEAVRRAYEGVEEPLVYQGQFTFPEKLIPVKDPETGLVVGHRSVRGKKPLAIRKYSDGLLQFLLKGFRPAVYRDRVATEISGPDGGPIPLAGNDRLKDLTDEELAAAIAIARKLSPDE